MNKLIGILSVKCNDPGFNDFHEDEYLYSLVYSQRKVARKYSLLNRHYAFFVKGDASVPVVLKLHSFTAEIMVKVNGVEYTRGDNQTLDPDNSIKQYQLYYGTHDYLFNYTGREDGDIIEIDYEADITDDDLDDESITPIVPAKYDDEIIKFALLYLSEAGIAKFRDAKREKYEMIYKLNQRKIEGTESGEKQTWPEIKAYKVI